MVIIIDSREQLPYRFPNCEVKIKGLKTGDYSLEGHEDHIAIERKTLPDLFSSLGVERNRFEREFKRLAEIGYAALVVEGHISDILRGVPFSKMNPRSVIASLLAWSIKYDVHVFFAGDRTHGNALTNHLLHKFYHYYTLKMEMESKTPAHVNGA